MYMNLKCPQCGFAFGIAFPDDETEEGIREIKTCPCGAMMEETDRLSGNVFEPMEED